MPNIIFKGSPNFTQGHPTPVVAIVNHITQGGRASVLSTFQNPDPNQQGGQRSTHFLVCTDGQIWQFVALANSAWGNGIWQAPDTSVPWIATAFAKGDWPNGCTIQIETEGTSGNPLTEVQYQATLALQRWLLDYFGLPANRQHINGHYQIQSIEKANCPGSAYPWTRLMGDLTVFNPNPNNYSIGGGMLIELNNRHLTAATPENYLTVQPGQLPQSELFTVEGPILKGIKKPDNSGQWIIRVVNPM